MLKMTITDWQKRIDRQFEAGLFNEVLIGDSRETKELTNFEYCILPSSPLTNVEAPIHEEKVERDFVVLRSKAVAEFIVDDVNSRRASFVNNYDAQDNHCIAYFHHYVRDSKYCMNVYVRSMNYVTNFVFDNETFCIAYNEVFEILKKHHFIEQGFIRVFAFSMHIYKD